MRRCFRSRRVVYLGAVLVVLAAALIGSRVVGPVIEAKASAATYQPIESAAAALTAPQVFPEASTGTYTVDCGANSAEVRNSDNLVVSPGLPGAAHHLHEYVGNASTNAFSTEATLNSADTSCSNGDLSSYYWPVLRIQHSDMAGEEHAHSAGAEDEGVLTPRSVLIEFRGSMASNVVSLATNVRTAAGNAHGFSQSGEGSEHVRWSCSGTRERETGSYPLCPPGEDTVRSFDFPSCWNGRSVDSEDHRSHLTYPSTSGFCPAGTFPVPQLHLEVAYPVPSNARFAIDTFPEERSSSLSDHAHFINLMSPQLMDEAVACINEDRHCRA